MAMPSLMLNPFWENCLRTSELILIMAFFDSLFLNLEKVEWSGEGISKGSFKNFLKEMRSFYPVKSFDSHVLYVCFVECEGFQVIRGFYAKPQTEV